MNWGKLLFIMLAVTYSSFTVFAADRKVIEPPTKKIPYDITCYQQKVITSFMKKNGYKIFFNWMSRNGKIIKLMAVNKKASVLVVHIHDSKMACIVDKFGNNTHADNLFMELFFGKDGKSSW